MNARAASRLAFAFLRSAKLTLLAVIVGVASPIAGLFISLFSAVLMARRLRREAAAHRRRRDLRAMQAAKQAEWDARWESWGGRIPTTRI